MDRTRTIWLAASAAVAVAIVMAMFTPVMSGAWPWDDDRDIEVKGSIQCKGLDVDSDVPFYPYARVEGFEIRGLDHVARIEADGWKASFDTHVPAGWVIEWSVKCSNASGWQHGSFPINKADFGSAYEVTRHVCVGGGPYEPCGDEKLGSCLEALITHQLNTNLPFGTAFKILYHAYNDSQGISNDKCLQALRDSTTNLSQTPVPTAQPTRSPITDDGPTAMPTLTAEPTHSSAPHASTPRPTPAETPIPAPKVGVVQGCNTYGSNCDGDPIYVNVPQPGYNWKTEPKITTVNNGTSLTARCWTTGATVYNWAVSVNDPGPDPYDSDVFFNVQAPNGSWGWIPDTYFVRDKYGRFGLPHC